MKEEKNKETQILESATKLFLEKGFARTSTTEIAKAAGCNQALVHYYFRTKDKLFEAIFKTKMKTFIESVFSLKQDYNSFEERLALMIGNHFDVISANPKIPSLLLSELNANPDRLKMLGTIEGGPKEVIKVLESELIKEIKAGNVREMSVYDLLFAILSLNISIFLIEKPFRAISGIANNEFKSLLQRRKKENIEIILKGIKP